MEKIKITFYTNIPTPYQLDFFEALSKIFDLHVVFYSLTESNRQWTFDLSNLTYRTTILKNSILVKPIQKKYVAFHFSWGLFRVAFFDKSDLVITGGSYNAPNTILAIFIARYRKKKLGFFGERIRPSKSWLWKLLKQLLIYPLKRCNFLLCIGDAARESYEELGIRKPKHVIAYNINDSAFQEASLNQSKLKKLKSLYNQDGSLLILTSGALIPRKGVDTLIKVIQSIDADEYKVRLLVLGEGTERSSLEKLAAQDDRIVFLGFKNKEEIPYYFTIADIFAFATRYDGWGLVINEALASGLPILSTYECTAAQELIKNGENGFLCHAGDVDCFSKHLKILAQNEFLRQEMRQHNKILGTEVNSEASAQKLYQIAKNYLA